jgi:hypothetical protein
MKYFVTLLIGAALGVAGFRLYGYFNVKRLMAENNMEPILNEYCRDIWSKDNR